MCEKAGGEKLVALYKIPALNDTISGDTLSYIECCYSVYIPSLKWLPVVGPRETKVLLAILLILWTFHVRASFSTMNFNECLVCSTECLVYTSKSVCQKAQLFPIR